jgi:hypothetical protein
VGTAVLGGIMNSRLSAQTQGLQNEPFVTQMKGLDLGATASHFDGSFIQSVLNQDNQQHIKDLITKLPAASRPVAVASFDQFVDAAKLAFSHAIDNVFLVAASFMCISLGFVFFLPQIPLRSSDRPAMEEAGVLLEDELAQSDKDCQPRAHAADNKRSPAET